MAQWFAFQQSNRMPAHSTTSIHPFQLEPERGAPINFAHY